jgi:hypothetical protein
MFELLRGVSVCVRREGEGGRDVLVYENVYKRIPRRRQWPPRINEPHLCSLPLPRTPPNLRKIPPEQRAQRHRILREQQPQFMRQGPELDRTWVERGCGYYYRYGVGRRVREGRRGV